MLDWTDRHYRAFARLLTKRTTLYTEMVVDQALLRGDRDRFLPRNPEDRPTVVQLGGSEPETLAEAAKIAEERGYDQIGLNAGCPSDRVQSGKMGACLMAEPDLVARCVEAMVRAVKIPVSVKTRIGIDESDSYGFLETFATRVMAAGCDHLVVHARKAWLKGLSPRENRTVPPLLPERVYALKEAHPDWTVVLNGGVDSWEKALAHLERVDGVMIGRAAYENLWMLRGADAAVFGDAEGAASLPATQVDAVRAWYPYVERELARGERLKWMTRHLLGLFRGCDGARRWRQELAEGSARSGAGLEVVEAALRHVAS